MAALLLVAAGASAAEAKNRALLIGASDYTHNDKIRDLQGPRNDATAMWRYLKSAGYAEEDIVVLSDGLPVTADFPTLKGRAEYQAIIDELDRLAAQDYAAGDTVVFFYAGHGSTVVDDNPAAELEPEANGRDQILLPTDTGKWTEAGTLPNVLVDDELGKKLTAIRARGVTVWVIIDACNSGGGTRGLEETARYVSPEAFGLPDEFPAVSESRGAERSGALAMPAEGPGMGRLVAFYAVDSFNLAWERHFDFADYQKPVFGDDETTQRMGTFSNYLNRALVTGNAQTYEQLFQEIVAGIAADPDSSSRPRPVADGELSLALPGSNNGAWRLKGVLEGGTLRIPAGTFQGFEQSAGITVYDPADPDTALATGTITSATAANSLVNKLYWLDPTKEIKTAGAPLPVRVTEPVTKFVFTVGQPTGLDALPAAEKDRVGVILAEAFAVTKDSPGLGVALGLADAPDLNLRTHVEDNRLWLLYPHQTLVKDDGAFGQTISVDFSGPDAASDLRNALWRLGRAERLVRAAVTHTARTASMLEFNAGLYRREALAADPRQACEAHELLSAAELERMRRSTGAGPLAAGNCDIVRVSISNRSTIDDYYVGGFYVDALGGVSSQLLHGAEESAANCVYALPRKQDGALHFEFPVITWNGTEDRPAPVGLERFVIIAEKQGGTGLPPNLCRLTQESLTTEIAHRGAGVESDLEKLLGDIAGDGTRGVPGRAQAAPKVAMETFMLELEVRP